MARKLTEQERDNVEALRATLTEALPPAQRGIASGIASALVRTPADTVTEDDLSRILGKYDEADASVAQVVRDTLLDPVDGEDGTYTLRVPESEGVDADAPTEVAEAAEGADASEVQDDGRADEAGSGDQGMRPEDLDETSSAEQPQDSRGDSPSVTETSAGDVPAGKDEVPGKQGSSATSEQQEASPAPKPKRTRHRAPRTHKTAQPSQESTADGTSPSSEGKDKPAKEPKRAKDKAKVKESKDTKDAREAKDAKAPDDTPEEKTHRKEQPPARDLKKVPYVRRGGESEAEVRAKILQLDQRFWVNGWLLSHPGAYTLFEPELVAINDALSDGMLPGDITRRQLAYQMGGDEKFFEYGSDGFRLLRAMGMEDVIRHRPMPKPDLVYYAPRRRKHMRVLVTENLDPYLDVHDLMYEDGRTAILGQRIHAVVLGGGTPILEKNRLALLLDTLGADTITVLYWGDIDRAGLEIMVKLKEVLGDGYKFRAFAPAYQLMVDKAMERFPDPADNESTGQVNIEPMDTSLMVKGLTDEAAAYAKAVIDDCGLIPQEILTRRDL